MPLSPLPAVRWKLPLKPHRPRPKPREDRRHAHECALPGKMINRQSSRCKSETSLEPWSDCGSTVATLRLSWELRWLARIGHGAVLVGSGDGLTCQGHVDPADGVRARRCQVDHRPARRPAHPITEIVRDLEADAGSRQHSKACA
jgi:hypothetical protein